MAIGTNCWLSLSPPPRSNTNSKTTISLPSTNSRNSTQVSCPPKARSWKAQSSVLTCVIIGIELGNFVFTNNQVSATTEDVIESAVGSNSTVKVQRWSDRRNCQPWRVNSLEIIVPENLPRPSAHRSWAAEVGFPPEGAPPIIVLPKYGTKSCHML